MIAQILTSGSAPAATPSGAAKAPAAAQGFAALMRGQEDALAPQVPVKAEPSAVKATAGQGTPAQAAEAEGPEALMALLGKTIATLHQSAEQVTPKRVLAEFAGALGAPMPEQLGDLEAVAKLADPALLTALQEKIDGALRIASGVGQLSVASAAVPVVGRGAAVNPVDRTGAGVPAALASGASSTTAEAAAITATSETATTPAPAFTPKPTAAAVPAKGAEASAIAATSATAAPPAPGATPKPTAAAIPANGAEAPATTEPGSATAPQSSAVNASGAGTAAAPTVLSATNVEDTASVPQSQAKAREQTPPTAPAMAMAGGAPQANVGTQTGGKAEQAIPSADTGAPKAQTVTAPLVAAQTPAAAASNGTAQGAKSAATPTPEAAAATSRVATAVGQTPTSATKTAAPQPAVAVTSANQSGAAPTGLPPLTQFANAASATPADASAQTVMATPPLRGQAGAVQANKTPATSPLALGAEAAAQGGDPRTRAAEPAAPGVKLGDFAAALPTGADALSREAASLAAPQSAPQGEAPRLAPPSPVPAPPPNPAAPPEEQLRQHVAQQIRGLEAADNKLRFALSPYGMGEIEIEVVRLESGRMQIAMTTESAAVMNMLRQDREQLLEALQSRGLDADSADLDFQTFDDRGRGSGRERFAPDLTRAEAGALPEDPASDSAQDGTPAQRMTSGPGQLDILT